MAADTISLTFNGYWKWTDLTFMPNEAGIYVVYDGAWGRSTKVFTLKQTLFIGEAERTRDRIMRHERWNDWRRGVKSGGELYFAFAPAEFPARLRAEAALIFEHQPLLNVEHKLEFPFQDTTMIVDGRSGLLRPALVLRGRSSRVENYA
jgi:hypothetical protein